MDKPTLYIGAAVMLALGVMLLVVLQQGNAFAAAGLTLMWIGIAVKNHSN